MKKLLTLSILAAFATVASAQVPMGRPDANGIIYSLNPLPPVVSNNRVNYAPGAPYIDASGVNRACQSGLVVDHASGNPHAICADKPALSADNFSQMAPAAGGPQPRSDRNLASDSKIGLPNDHALGVQ